MGGYLGPYPNPGVYEVNLKRDKRGVSTTILKNEKNKDEAKEVYKNKISKIINPIQEPDQSNA